MLTTQRIASLDLDATRLDADLTKAKLFSYNDSYSEFICGSLRSVALWNQSGDISETLLQDYAGAARPTTYGECLPYIDELIRQLFDIEQMKYARLVRLSPGSVIVPHRDYLELGENFARIHIPLRTDGDCYHSQGKTVYHMRRGEVWLLDAANIHSAASFSTSDRIHLILDFATDRLDSVLRFDLAPDQSIPESSILPRRPLDITERVAFQRLSGVIDMRNYQDVLCLIIKRHFVVDMSAGDVFEWIKEIAVASGQSELLARAVQQEEYCLGQR